MSAYLVCSYVSRRVIAAFETEREANAYAEMLREEARVSWNAPHYEVQKGSAMQVEN